VIPFVISLFSSSSVQAVVLTKRDLASPSLKGENPGQAVAAGGSKEAVVVVVAAGEAVEADRSCLQRSWMPSWTLTTQRYEHIRLHAVCYGSDSDSDYFIIKCTTFRKREILVFIGSSTIVELQ